jgi:hypothetical protein
VCIELGRELVEVTIGDMVLDEASGTARMSTLSLFGCFGHDQAVGAGSRGRADLTAATAALDPEVADAAVERQALQFNLIEIEDLLERRSFPREVDVRDFVEYHHSAFGHQR